jgi:hypothetical protein
MKTITVEELFKLCKEEKAKGNGKKKILISGDDEGNSYHELFFGFTPTQEEGNPQDFFGVAYIDRPYGITDENVNDYIILG